MKATLSRRIHGFAGALALSCFALTSVAQTPGTVWTYTLVNGSQLIDDCPICDRVAIVVPMRGTFQLRLVQQGPLFFNYALDNIDFTASLNGRTYKVAGQGTYRIGGELAVLQDLFLQVWVDNGFTNELCLFTNASPFVTRSWPMFQIGVDQTNGTMVEQYHLDISAAPFRELWFSTLKGFTAGIWNSPTNEVSGGDLLSLGGRIVRTNRSLTAAFMVQPPVPDAGLKDIDIVPGGETVFSVEQDLFSEALGVPLRSGDLLSDAGRVVRTNGQLVAAFVPSALSPYPGLAAAQIMDDGQIYFSVQNAFDSQKLGTTIQPGDLLSDNGSVVKTGQQLLLLFNPAKPAADYGLRTVYVWPGGETWFSTRDGFTDALGHFYAAGDLLSDRGYLVYSNAEVVANFSPLGVAGDLGLDALYLVSDVTVENSAPLLKLNAPTDQPPASVTLARKGGGRVFQLERADSVAGPYVAVSPITTALNFVDPGAMTNRAQAFYRLRQW